MESPDKSNKEGKHTKKSKNFYNILNAIIIVKQLQFP